MVGDTQPHDTGYDSNREDTKCWADCSCGSRGPVLNGSASDEAMKKEMRRWANWHRQQEAS